MAAGLQHQHEQSTHRPRHDGAVTNACTHTSSSESARVKKSARRCQGNSACQSCVASITLCWFGGPVINEARALRDSSVCGLPQHNRAIDASCVPVHAQRAHARTHARTLACRASHRACPPRQPAAGRRQHRPPASHARSKSAAHPRLITNDMPGTRHSTKKERPPRPLGNRAVAATTTRPGHAQSMPPRPPPGTKRCCQQQQPAECMRSQGAERALPPRFSMAVHARSNAVHLAGTTASTNKAVPHTAPRIAR